jgi:6-phosphogluconate dehydrogenase
MKIAVLGLGKMGSRIAIKLHEEGHEVFVWNRSFDVTKKFVKSLRGPVRNFPSPLSSKRAPFGPLASARSRLTGLRAVGSPSFPATPSRTIQELVSKLPKPRILWLMLPAGKPTEEVLSELKQYLQKGDIVIDGGNAHFKDTQRRFAYFKKIGVEFLGIGVSGGIVVAKSGYPLMVGGSKIAYQKIKPILDSLSSPNGGYQYFGEGGAGHFVKMVHNGIEYGMMQSLAEGFAVLEKSKYKFNLLDVAKIWQKGTIISGFLLDRAVDSLAQNPNLKNMSGSVAESGEARWTVEEAKKEKVQTEIIQNSLNFRIRSQKDKKIQRSFTAKMLNALRNSFGGHEVKKIG